MTAPSGSSSSRPAWKWKRHRHYLAEPAVDPGTKAGRMESRGASLAIALVLFLALQFNAPMSKELAFDIPCEEFTRDTGAPTELP